MSRPDPEAFLLALLFVAVPAGGQLSTAGAQFWYAGSAGLTSTPESNLGFGSAVAAGDFDCDGLDDLAIGVPDHDDPVGPITDVGQVLVLYSTAEGLATPGHQIWAQELLAAQAGESGDNFGEVLVAGDFNGDACSDLVVGIPSEDIGSTAHAGAIQVIYGAAGGLSDVGNAFFRQGADGVPGAVEESDQFGASLAVGDFNSDGFDDLAIGVPGEDIESVSAEDAGAVQILFGSNSIGLTGAADLILVRGSGLPGAPETGEELGAALAAGRFDAQPGDDLAIAAPNGLVPPESPDGGLIVLVLNPAGPTTFVTLSQNSDGAPDSSEDGEGFGRRIVAGDFDGDGFDELAVSVFSEDLEGPSISSAGAVSIFDLDGGEHTLWVQSDLAPNVSEPNDYFGYELASGDFDADGIDDLAITAQLEDVGEIMDVGMVHVLYGERGSGLSSNGSQSLYEELDPIEGGDYFGFALAAGHFRGSSGAGLAVGVRFENFVGFPNSGAVNIFYSIALFVDDFESGNTGRWSSSAP